MKHKEWLGLAWALAGVVGSARSQQASQEPAAGTLEEIVVTAQKRMQNLQDVPISVQVVSAKRLAEQNLNSLSDVAATVPSVNINPDSGGSGRFFIRGIGSGQDPRFDQSAGVFIDDIYHGRGHVSGASFLDLERVEILKGPQSTFFGNSAIAGAFNIVTKKPGDQFDASARALYGEGGQYAVDGAVGGPITDTFGVRVAATLNGESGWLKNVYTGQHQPDEDNQAGRVTLLFKPNDVLDATLKVEASRKRNQSGSLGIFGQIDDCPPPAPFVASGFCAAAIGLGIPRGTDNNQNAESPQAIDLDTHESVLTANYHFAGLTLTSVSGFYNYDYKLNADIDRLPPTLFNLQVLEKFHQFSQELRIASPADRPLEYLAGVYFQTDRLTGIANLNFAFLNPLVQFVLPPVPFGALVPFLPLGSGTDNVQNEHLYAAFGSASWNVTDRLKLTAGLRGSKVNKDFSTSSFYGTATRDYGGIVALPAGLGPLAAAILGPQIPAAGASSDTGWTPSARIQYKFDPAAMVYVSYARGFKAGVPEGGTRNGVPSFPLGPEYVNSYEAGLKSEWLDHRVLANLAIFRSDYSSLQVETLVIAPSGLVTVVSTNAARSRSQGMEFEGQWALGSHFRLSATGTYLDSKYLSYPSVARTQLQTLLDIRDSLGRKAQDLSGRPTIFAPKWSGSVSGAFTTKVPGDYQLTTELNAYYSAKYFSDPLDDPQLQAGNYTRLDGRLGLATTDGRWAIDLLVKNLTDRKIITFKDEFPVSPGSTDAYKEQPRNFAVQVRYHY